MKGITRILLISQIVVTSVLCSVSFFWHIPLIITYDDFKGKCVLFASGEWSPNKTNLDHMMFTNIQWGSPIACNFNVFVAALSSMFAIFYIFWESLFLCRGIDNSRIDGIIASIISVTMTVFTFLASLVYSIGFSHWCAAITVPQSHISKCESAQSERFLDDSTIDTSLFYAHLQLSQFGCWSVWVSWLLFTFVCLVKNARHKREATFLRSLGKERERLLESFSSGNESL